MTQREFFLVIGRTTLYGKSVQSRYAKFRHWLVGDGPIISPYARLFLLGIILSFAVLTLASRLQSGKKPHATKSSGSAITCALQKVTDSQRTGMVAYTYLVPKGWTPSSSFAWNKNGTYTAEFGAVTPDKQYRVDKLGAINLMYTASTGMAPSGVRLTHATDFLEFLVGQMNRQGLATNIKIIEEFNTPVPLSDTLKLIKGNLMAPGMSQTIVSETGYLKITFEKDGAQGTADLGTTVSGSLLMTRPSTTGFHPRQGPGNTYTSDVGTYVVGPTLYVVSPTSPSSARVKEAQIIASSVRATPKFTAYIMQMVASMAKSSADATFQRGKQFLKDQQAWREESMAKFKSDMAAKDAHTHDFCNYLLDQRDFVDRDGSTVALPSYYNHGWSDGSGNYILTNDINYEPYSNDFQRIKMKPLAGQD